MNLSVTWYPNLPLYSFASVFFFFFFCSLSAVVVTAGAAGCFVNSFVWLLSLAGADISIVLLLSRQIRVCRDKTHLL